MPGRALDQPGERDQGAGPHRLFECGRHPDFVEVPLERLVHRQTGLEPPHELRGLGLVGLGQRF